MCVGCGAAVLLLLLRLLLKTGGGAAAAVLLLLLLLMMMMMTVHAVQAQALAPVREETRLVQPCRARHGQSKVRGRPERRKQRQRF